MTDREAERAAVVAWLRAAADTQEGCALELANADMGGFYSADAAMRYRAAATAIESLAHLPSDQETR